MWASISPGSTTLPRPSMMCREEACAATSSAVLPRATIRSPSRASAPSVKIRRSPSTVTSQSALRIKMSAMDFELDELRNRSLYFQLDDDVLFLGIRRGKRTVGDPLGNNKHLAGLERDIAQLCLPMNRPLIA